LKGLFSITPVCFLEPRIKLSKHYAVPCRGTEHKAFTNALLVSNLVVPANVD
jgi:hypothetical protein